jgi:hypothetical protein
MLSASFLRGKMNSTQPVINRYKCHDFYFSDIGT